ncbi:hypothetical protein ABZU32_00940 [Sphaerisporangium sp. NPDC005288]|uniref:hypothetical protein n=1 Tax=Sphaerisporangium sp. NPDC005288 TaxID=3155114 RepID=UPI0033B42BEB
MQAETRPPGRVGADLVHQPGLGQGVQPVLREPLRGAGQRGGGPLGEVGGVEQPEQPEQPAVRLVQARVGGADGRLDV